MRTTSRQKPSKTKKRIYGMSERSLHYALCTPQIASYAARMQHIPEVYKEITKKAK